MHVSVKHLIYWNGFLEKCVDDYDQLSFFKCVWQLLLIITHDILLYASSCWKSMFHMSLRKQNRKFILNINFRKQMSIREDLWLKLHILQIFFTVYSNADLIVIPFDWCKLINIPFLKKVAISTLNECFIIERNIQW